MYVRGGIKVEHTCVMCTDMPCLYLWRLTVSVCNVYWPVDLRNHIHTLDTCAHNLAGAPTHANKNIQTYIHTLTHIDAKAHTDIL